MGGLPMDGVWESVKEYLKCTIPQAQFEMWVNPIKLGKCSENHVVLLCPNEFHRQWVRGKLSGEILKAWMTKGLSAPVITWDVVKNENGFGNENGDSELERISSDRGTSVGTAVQVPLNEIFVKWQMPRLNSRFTFEQFVVGDSNRFAYSASRVMANGQNIYNNALYILADPGLGKSHLSQAVGNYLLKKKRDVRLCYLTAEDFANEMISALKSEKIEKFKEKYRKNCDLLILEKIEFLSGKMKMQSEFAYTLDFLLDSGKRFICTSNYYPQDIPKLRKDLRSRLSGVLITPIDPPDFETRTKIVRKKAEAQALKLPAKVVDFLAERITKDIRQLESCIAGLVLKSNITKRPIDLALAREVLETMIDSRPGIDIERIKEVVARSFRIKVEDLSSPSRKRSIAYPRNICMYFCQEYTNESISNIGKAFGRTHSTVIYATNRLRQEIKNSPRIKREIEFLRDHLETYCLRER
ncbi:MAG: chromosomal replication initiator protein DnaA [Deltaproteobacteria bacterium]|nr:MAG: chromosomal replication initiator protein DnaA [Deltaproteobacteria bacterium]HEC31273.1 chromosomal replication initiator protein DnaA [Deltaproteobacteria bacterium]